MHACAITSHPTLAHLPSQPDPRRAAQGLPRSDARTRNGMDVPDLLKRAQDMLVSPTSPLKAVTKAKQQDVGALAGRTRYPDVDLVAHQQAGVELGERGTTPPPPALYEGNLQNLDPPYSVSADDWVDLNAAEESDSGWTTPSCASSQPGTPRANGTAVMDSAPVPSKAEGASAAIATPAVVGQGKMASTQTTGEIPLGVTAGRVSASMGWTPAIRRLFSDFRAGSTAERPQTPGS